MKVLILSMDASKNAKSAATAMAEQFEKAGVVADIVDSLILVPEKANKLIHWNTSRTYRSLARRDGKAYFLEELQAAQTLYRLCSPGASSLHSILETGGYDAVLCVHIFAGMMMTAVSERYTSVPPFYFVSTDYTTGAGTSRLKATGYLIPHRMLFGDFIRYGFSADQLYATGIPIRPQFYAPPKNKAKVRAELGLPETGRIVLLRSGVMQKITPRKVLSLLRALPDDTYLIALCGANEKIAAQLKAIPKERLIVLSGNIDPYSYLQVADLCISRPSGLFCAETIVSAVPLVLFREAHGVEAQNFKFLLHGGVAEGSGYWREVIQQAGALLTDEKLRNQQAQAARSFLPPNPADSICKILLRSQKSD